MKSFSTLISEFESRFNIRHFPSSPANLYDAAQYILSLGGKRIRPACVLMGNELFGDIEEDAFHAAAAIELFHNFSLIHDDIMDKAPLRRGMETVHVKFGDATALLSGDVMLVVAYEYLNRIRSEKYHQVISLFNKTAKEVCEGQQSDMDFEQRDSVTFDEYEKMISLKTSVLLAASLQLGAMIGGAGAGNQEHIYQFGKNLGMAFQVQDDYLDAFGDPVKVGKQNGGDIIAKKKTFLLIYALENCGARKKELIDTLNSDKAGRVQKVKEIYLSCGADKWALDLQKKYMDNAYRHLDDIAVLSSRKEPLKELCAYLISRQN